MMTREGKKKFGRKTAWKGENQKVKDRRKRERDSFNIFPCLRVSIEIQTEVLAPDIMTLHSCDLWNWLVQWTKIVGCSLMYRTI